MEPHHETVFLEEAVEALEIAPGDTVVDATVGGAGHFIKLLSKLDSTGTIVGIDADSDALNRAKEKTTGKAQKNLPRIELVENNFRNFSAILDKLGIDKVDKSLFDLGWSGFQLTSGRGFSFQQKDEPLLMTYGKNEGNSVAEIVNSSSEEELTDILRTFGEERFARPIAKAIVHERQNERILTTGDLVRVIEVATPAWYQHRRVHPATRTFQALRIAVNDELGALRDGIASAVSRSRTGGRVAVITFHSIEDRIVKNMFRDFAYEGKGTVVTRKPIVPSKHELETNRRSRSAKLRVFACGDSITKKTITHSIQRLYA
ncbi:MAG TPA: 16S rRNA (cytosine(1402)-N(4))-methyltransferase RsmH [Candidatus Kaiserbacteria bacterium]|nr:16S rRNA (cytosine(1402)-N(4))-methyltransferase RsmH [Candidatus Kaiserbacteria bacterium]